MNLNLKNIYNKTILDLSKSKLTIENVFTIGYLAACKDHNIKEINQKNRYNLYTKSLKLDNQLQLKRDLIRDFDIKNFPKGKPIIVKRRQYSNTISNIHDIRKLQNNSKLISRSSKYSKATIHNYEKTIYCINKMNHKLKYLKFNIKN